MKVLLFLLQKEFIQQKTKQSFSELQTNLWDVNLLKINEDELKLFLFKSRQLLSQIKEKE